MSLFFEAPPDSHMDSRIEDIREAMLASLDGIQPSDALATVVGRLRCAPHIQVLWYVRSDMMTLLASEHGELVARERLQRITELFVGLLPPGHKSRPSPLNRN